MNHFSYSEIGIEDLLGWTDRLEALGDVISFLAWANEGDECFHRSGQELGHIVIDYSKAICEAIGKASNVLQPFFELGEVSLLAELKETQKDIQKEFMGLHGNLGLIREALQKIEQFVSKDLREMLDIQEDLQRTGEKIRKELMASEDPQEKNGPLPLHDTDTGKGPEDGTIKPEDSCSGVIC